MNLRDPDGYIEVKCGDHVHRIAYRHVDGPYDAQFEMMDHDEDQVRAFVEFGAKPPGCLEALKLMRSASAEWRKQHGKWTGLNWTEHFGATGVELEPGITQHDAVAIAFDWQDVPRHLKELEETAELAEQDTAGAMESIFAGHFDDAQAYASDAWNAEKDASEYRSEVWRRFYHLVDQLLPYQVDLEDDDA
jgi:hypothetical protein